MRKVGVGVFAVCVVGVALLGWSALSASSQAGAVRRERSNLVRQTRAQLARRATLEAEVDAVDQRNRKLLDRLNAVLSASDTSERDLRALGEIEELMIRDLNASVRDSSTAASTREGMEARLRELRDRPPKLKAELDRLTKDAARLEEATR